MASQLIGRVPTSTRPSVRPTKGYNSRLFPNEHIWLIGVALRGFIPRRQVISRAGLTADRASLDITKMEPLGDRILIKPLEAEESTEGGILLPTSATDTGRDARFGEVLSIGDEVDLEVSKGDMVVFNMFSSAKVEIADGEIVFVHDKNILAKLN